MAKRAVKRRKKRFLRRAAASMRRRGTVGSFTRYCKSLGYGGVTNACIRRGLKSKDPKIRKRAGFAKAARTIARRRKRK